MEQSWFGLNQSFQIKRQSHNGPAFLFLVFVKSAKGGFGEAKLPTNTVLSAVGL